MRIKFYEAWSKHLYKHSSLSNECQKLTTKFKCNDQKINFFFPSNQSKILFFEEKSIKFFEHVYQQKGKKKKKIVEVFCYLRARK